MNIKNFFKNNYVAIIGWVLFFGCCFAYMTFGSWVIPTSDPPAGNVEAPIKSSSESQEKEGSLTLSGGLISTGLSLFQNTVNFKSSSNSDTFLEILDASNNTLFLADTVNGRIGIHTYLPSTDFDIVGNTGITGNLSVTGSVTAVNGNIVADGSGSVISNEYCMGVDCITEWPTGGSSGGDSVTAPFLLSLSDNDQNLVGGGYTLSPFMYVPFYDTPIESDPFASPVGSFRVYEAGS